MLGITDLGTYVIGAIAIILLPGPNSLYVLTTAARRGVRAGYAGACGVFVGDTVLMVLAAIGGTQLMRAAPQVFDGVRMMGAAYLVWIGLQLLRGVWREARRGPGPAQPVPQAPAADLAATAAKANTVARPAGEDRPFRKALLISLLNPKAIIFLLSFFLQFVDPAYPHPALTFLALGTIIQVLSFVYLSTLIFAGARLAAAFRSRMRLARGATATVGAAFVGFGAKLAASSV